MGVLFVILSLDILVFVGSVTLWARSYFSQNRGWPLLQWNNRPGKLTEDAAVGGAVLNSIRRCISGVIGFIRYETCLSSF